MQILLHPRRLTAKAPEILSGKMLLGITILSFFLGPFCHFSGGTIPTLNIGVNRLNGFCKKKHFATRLEKIVSWTRPFSQAPRSKSRHLWCRRNGPKVESYGWQGLQVEAFYCGDALKLGLKQNFLGGPKKTTCWLIFFRHHFGK